MLANGPGTKSAIHHACRTILTRRSTPYKGCVVSCKHKSECRLDTDEASVAAQRVCQKVVHLVDGARRVEEQHHAALVTQHDVVGVVEKARTLKDFVAGRDARADFGAVGDGVEERERGHGGP